MKRLTRQELENELTECRKHADLDMIGLQCAINGEFDYISPWVKEEKSEGKYQYRLARSTSASGGYLLTTFRYPGQRDSTRVTYFEDFFRPDWFVFAEPKMIHELEKVRMARDAKIQESERAA